MHDHHFDNIPFFDFVDGLVAVQGRLRLHEKCKLIESITVQYAFPVVIEALKILMVNNKATLRVFQAAPTRSATQIEPAVDTISHLLNPDTLESLILAPGLGSRGLVDLLIGDRKFPRMKRLIVLPEALNHVDRLINNIGHGIEYFGVSSPMNSRQENNFFSLIADPKFSQLKAINVGCSTQWHPTDETVRKLVPTLGERQLSAKTFATSLRHCLRKNFPPKIPFRSITFSNRTIFEYFMKGEVSTWAPILASRENAFDEFLAEFHSGPVAKHNDVALMTHLLINAPMCNNKQLMQRIFAFVIEALESIILGPYNNDLLGLLVYYTGYRYYEQFHAFEPRVIKLLKLNSPEPHIVALRNSQVIFRELLKDEEFLSRYQTIPFHQIRTWPHIQFRTAVALLRCPKVDIFMHHERKVPLIRWWLRRRRGISCFDDNLYQLAAVFKAHRERLSDHPFLGELLHYSPFFKRMLSLPDLFAEFSACIVDEAEELISDSFIQFVIGNRKLDLLVQMLQGKPASVSWLSEKVWTGALLLRYGPDDAEEHALRTFVYVRTIISETPTFVLQFASGEKDFPVSKESRRPLLRGALQQLLPRL
jgi:hypothetical protein